ncbi:MAG TPA: DUF6797 domain-containing protein [Planctomycetota bacterium]
MISLLVAALAAQTPPAEEKSPFKARVYKQALEMDYGPWIAATVGAGKDNTVYKGVVLSLDPAKKTNVLFDTELLRVAAVWTDGWLDLASRAYADDSNDYCWIRGSVRARTPVAPGWGFGDKLDDPRDPKDGPLPREWGRWKGLYRHGNRVVLSYTVGSAEVLDSFRLDNGVVVRDLNIGGPLTLVAGEGWSGGPLQKLAAGRHRLSLGASKGEAEDLAPFTKGGPALWEEPIITEGVRGADDAAYVVDTLTAPENNPFKSWLRFTGVDFLPDGRAALCTWSGDVWIVSGLDGDLKNLSWRRFAAGLGQPMGLKVVDGLIYTAARDQITRLHDLNKDGEADFYENFNNDIRLTTNFHEFVFDLQTDAKGDFYTAKGSAIWAGSLRMTEHSGTVIRVPKDGGAIDVLCNGLRAPNGLAISPDGLITCSDNQGNWVPECPINVIRKGANYGFAGHNQKAVERERPAIWIPMSVDKSPGSQAWVPDDRWGPLKGRMVITSYDCSISLALFEKIEDGWQGGVVRFPMSFPSGVMRGRFSPKDGQLYVAGMRGWSSRAAKDCCFQRVRYTGKPAVLPSEVKTRKDGLDILFTAPLDRESITPDAIGAVAFNVVRSGNYGSSEFTLSDPKKTGRERLEMSKATLSEDGRRVSLDLPGLKPVNNLILKFKVKAADGAPVVLDLNYTIHSTR